MQVVICTTYPVQVTVFVFYYTPDVGIKLIRSFPPVDTGGYSYSDTFVSVSLNPFRI